MGRIYLRVRPRQVAGPDVHDAVRAAHEPRHELLPRADALPGNGSLSRICQTGSHHRLELGSLQRRERGVRSEELQSAATATRTDGGLRRVLLAAQHVTTPESHATQ